MAKADRQPVNRAPLRVFAVAAVKAVGAAVAEGAGGRGGHHDGRLTLDHLQPRGPVSEGMVFSRARV